jgi:hypothetical protein
MTLGTVLWSLAGEFLPGPRRPPPRTADLAYERAGGYPEPRDLPPLLEAGEYRRRFVAMSGLPGRLAGALFDRAGIADFAQRLRNDPDEYDRLLRTEDIRWSPFPLPTLNACTVAADDPACPDPLARAARLVAAARSFHRELHAGTLEPDAFPGGPLEMGQYANLFGTCLYPGGSCSRVFKAPDSRHIAVLARGRVFRVDLPEADGTVDATALEGALRRVAELSATASPERSAAGWLTVADQPRRAALVAAARLLPGNRAALEAIARSFLVLCLDLDARPGTLAETARQVHVGDPGNRWYLASWQIVVCGNGKAGFIVSFPCGLDGNVVMRFSAELASRSRSFAPRGPGPAAKVRPLDLALPPGAEILARRNLDGVLAGEPCTFEIRDLGNRRLAAAGLKPDAAFNLALIATLRRALGSSPAVLEHVTLARYRGMGLSMAPVTTPQAVTLADFLAGDGADREIGSRLLAAAQAAHMAALSAARKALPLRVLTMLRLREAGWTGRPFAGLVAAATAGRPEVIVSQPGPRPQVVAVGRPGVRLPYVRHLGLHYQLRDDSILLIFMPGIDSDLRSADLAMSLERDLRRLLDLAARRAS